MDLEGIMPSEKNQSVKDKYHVISFIMWNLKTQSKMSKHKTEADS